MSETSLLLISDVNRMIRRRFDSRAKAIGVTRAQWQTLLGLRTREGTTQAALADYLDIEPITLCRMIDRLEEAGLVERRPNPEDRRAWRLYLTAAAQPVIESLRAVVAQLRAEALAGLSDADTEHMNASLDRIRSNLTARSGQAAQG